MFATTRSRVSGLALLVALLCACAAAPAWSAVPGGYDARPLDPLGPITGTLDGARAGAAVLNAGDVNADGRDDVLVAAPSAPLSATVTGRVYMYSGTTGELLWQAEPPAQPQADGAPTSFGAALARLGDIGRCTFGGVSTCTLDPTPDGAAEVLVAAPGADTGGTTGPDQGVVYVLDGAAGHILKDIRLSTAGRPVTGSAAFGAAVTGLAGQPPCAGFGGIGPCLLPDSRVATGDLDGGGTPDFVVGAPDYTEFDDGEYAGCPVGGGPCTGLGRVYVVHGELISGSSVQPLNVDGDNTSVVQFPGAAGAGDPPRFGSALTAAGDVGRCVEGDPGAGGTCVRPPVQLTNVPDGKPDFVAAAPGADAGATDAGAAFVVDAAGVAAMVQVGSPSPQTGAEFGSFAQSFPPPGFLDGNDMPDLVVGAPRHDDQGAAYLVNGDVLGSDPFIRTFTDPVPAAGGRFGSSLAGLGDISDDGIGDVAVGAAAGARVGAVHVLSSCARDVVQTIEDPDPQSEARFGAAVTPLGDVNSDGMLDLVVGVPGFDAGASPDRGRAYLLTSNGTPGQAVAGCAGGSGTGGGGAAGGSSGGGAKATPPPPSDKQAVVARVQRRLALRSNRKRVRKFKTFRLSGRLRASTNRTVCQRGQKVALQRRRGKGRYRTFDLAFTRKNGKFGVRTVAGRTYRYRARVQQTARCMRAVSKARKVSIARRSGRR